MKIDSDPERVLPEAGWSSATVVRLRRIGVTLVSVVLVISLIYAFDQWRFLQRVNPAGDPLAAQIFEVRPTDDLDELSRRLERAGIVVDDGTFREYVRREGGLDVTPGFYTVRPRDHMGNILRTLRTPPNETFYKVTFPEGFTLEQMGARLAEVIPGFDATSFVSRATGTDDEIQPSTALRPATNRNLEGLLFPDTYLFAADETPTQILQRMVRMMERVGRQEGIDSAPDRLGYSPYEILVIASMIEREAKVPADRSRIARVIYNRLGLGMKLEIDATVLYGQDVTRPFGELKALEGPYNTYVVAGLPPTPIANPGRASIAAALDPADDPGPDDPMCVDLPADAVCRYLYYVLADSEGGHAFAATLAQHEANVAKSREAGLLGPT